MNLLFSTPIVIMEVCLQFGPFRTRYSDANLTSDNLF